MTPISASLSETDLSMEGTLDDCWMPSSPSETVEEVADPEAPLISLVSLSIRALQINIAF